MKKIVFFGGNKKWSTDKNVKFKKRKHSKSSHISNARSNYDIVPVQLLIVVAYAVYVSLDLMNNFDRGLFSKAKSSRSIYI